MEPSTLETVEAGAWIGRQQAFAVIGSKCTAAQAQCLREIRESRAYEKLGLTWEDFCTGHAAISRSQADNLIRQLDEFGETYFRLSELARISPEAYRQIAARVHDESIELDGALVPLTPENAPKIRAGIQSLRAELKRKSEYSDLCDGRMIDLSDRLDSLLRDFNNCRKLPGLPDPHRTTLNNLAMHAMDGFLQISEALGKPMEKAE